MVDSGMPAGHNVLVHRIPADAGTSLGKIVTLQDVDVQPKHTELAGELGIAAAVTEALLSAAPMEVQRLIYASSIPLHDPHMGGFALAEAVGMAPAHAIDLGNHCAAILDALWLTLTLYNGETNLLVTPTQLGRGLSDEMRRTKPGSLQWCDGAAAVALGGDGPHFLRPLAYVTTTDPKLQTMLKVCPQDVGYEYDFREDVAAEFQSKDLVIELVLIRRALDAAGCDADELDGVVVVNRGRRRTLMLAPAFGVSPELVISSRKEIGHGGGADFFYNLRLWLDAQQPGTHKLMMIGNGLGYAWSALLLEVTIS
ncbi:MAG: hypothetical protein KC502_14780 [Myxococcales bacterium]|nr:hypothetical protein [Myxococcales bacterium]